MASHDRWAITLYAILFERIANSLLCAKRLHILLFEAFLYLSRSFLLSHILRTSSCEWSRALLSYLGVSIGLCRSRTSEDWSLAPGSTHKCLDEIFGSICHLNSRVCCVWRRLWRIHIQVVAKVNVYLVLLLVGAFVSFLRCRTQKGGCLAWGDGRFWDLPDEVAIDLDRSVQSSPYLLDDDRIFLWMVVFVVLLDGGLLDAVLYFYLISTLNLFL